MKLKKFVKVYPRYRVQKFRPKPGEYYISDGRIPDGELREAIYLHWEAPPPSVATRGTREEMCAFVEKYSEMLAREEGPC